MAFATGRIHEPSITGARRHAAISPIDETKCERFSRVGAEVTVAGECRCCYLMLALVYFSAPGSAELRHAFALFERCLGRAFSRCCPGARLHLFPSFIRPRRPPPAARHASPIRRRLTSTFARWRSPHFASLRSPSWHAFLILARRVAQLRRLLCPPLRRAAAESANGHAIPDISLERSRVISRRLGRLTAARRLETSYVVAVMKVSCRSRPFKDHEPFDRRAGGMASWAARRWRRCATDYLPAARPG